LTKAGLDRLKIALIGYYVARSDPDSPSNRSYHYLKRYVQLLSDIQFVVPQLREVVDGVERGSPTYVYQFSRPDPRLARLFPYPAAIHTSEYFYLNSVRGTFFSHPEEDVVAKRLVEVYVRFIKTGSPHPGTGDDWWPMMERGSLPVMEIGKEWRVVKNGLLPVVKSLQFWKGLGDA
jgi:carboxylesterase type B